MAVLRTVVEEGRLGTGLREHVARHSIQLAGGDSGAGRLLHSGVGPCHHEAGSAHEAQLLGRLDLDAAAQDHSPPTLAVSADCSLCWTSSTVPIASTSTSRSRPLYSSIRGRSHAGYTPGCGGESCCPPRRHGPRSRLDAQHPLDQRLGGAVSTMAASRLVPA